MKKINAVGHVYGRLTVLREVAPHVSQSGRKERKFLCRCECGNEVEKTLHGLRNGHFRSCGCLRNEMTSKRNKVHGLSGSSIMNIWSHMMRRCYNENTVFYDDYGGRGIEVCEKWKTFSGFIEDMQDGWFEGASIERVDVNGNYEKSNCKWIPRSDQAKNTRRTIYLKYNGKKYSFPELVDLSGIKYRTLYCRIFKHNWSIERAVNEPVRKW